MAESEYYEEKTIPLYEQVKIKIFETYQEALTLFGRYVYKSRQKDEQALSAILKVLYIQISPKIEEKKRIPLMEERIKENKDLTFEESSKVLRQLSDILENDIKITKITYRDIKTTNAYQY